MKKGKKSRRDFISQSAKSITLIAAGTTLAQFLESCSSEDNPVGPNESKTFTIDISESKYSVLQNVGGTIALSRNDINNLPSNGIFIIRSSMTSATVLSRTCTHQSCQVGAFIGSTAMCPCHGSKYNTSGGVVNGPANQPLKKYNSTLNGNILTFTI